MLQIINSILYILASYFYNVLTDTLRFRPPIQETIHIRLILENITIKGKILL